jgi:hypothetical protein
VTLTMRCFSSRKWEKVLAAFQNGTAQLPDDLLLKTDAFDVFDASALKQKGLDRTGQQARRVQCDRKNERRQFRRPDVG